MLASKNETRDRKTQVCLRHVMAPCEDDVMIVFSYLL